MKKRIGLITWHYYSNFGSALQAYALQQTIKNMDYEVKIINYRNPKFGRTNEIKELVKWITYKVCGDRVNKSYYSFQNKYLSQTRVVQDKKELGRVSKKIDIFICGSDQIWAPNVFNPVYMLDFVPCGKKKISYAASIGLNKLPPNCIKEYTHLLSDFASVSIREDAGAELLRTECGIIAQTVLDPTLLVNVDEWKELEIEPTLTNSKYIFCYFLNEEHCYSGLVKDYAEKYGYKIVGVSANKDDTKWMDLVRVGPREFLWLIHNAALVFTDSYHGTIFSLLYHKKLITFERFAGNDPICQNSRIYQLDNYFELDGILLNAAKIKEIKVQEFDYSKFENKLQALRIKSLDFLSNALEK